MRERGDGQKTILMKKKVLSAIIAGVVILTSVTSTARVVQATPDTEKVQEARGKYQELQNKVNDLNDKVQQIESEMTSLESQISDNKKQIVSLNSEIDDTNKEISKAKDDIAEKEKKLGKRLRELYKSGGETSLISLVFSADDFSDLITKIDTAGRIVSLDQNIVKDLNDNKDKLNDKVSALENKANEIQSLNEDNENKKNDLDSKKKEQSTLLEQAKSEKDEFDKQYLSTVEEELVSGYIEICKDASKSSSEIQSALDMLKSLKDNQIKSPTIIAEIESAISTGNSNKEKAQSREAEQAKEASESKKTQEGNKQEVTRGDIHVPSSKDASAIVNYASQFMGIPYVWGGTDPSGFDCSGFTSYVYKHAAGIDIGRDTYAQLGHGTPINDQSQLQIGDLVFPHSGHVGIYVGNGCIIHSPQTGDRIKISKIWKFYTARRIL